MEGKDWVSVAAVGVSLLSAWAAISARNEAQALADREFATEKTLEILASVYSEILEARTDTERAKWSCFFVVTLGNAEVQARQAPPYFVRAFVEDVARAGLWNPDCGSRLESLVSEATPAATQLSEMPEAAPGGDGDDGPKEIGQWHALIASYNVTDFGCGQAQKEVTRFATALAGMGLAGRYVYVVRTSISNNYAVTVDAGQDRSVAEEISAKVRSVAPGNGTGRDSFVQGNRGWTIDPACTRFARITN